jgi:hypothetical protein
MSLIRNIGSAQQVSDADLILNAMAQNNATDTAMPSATNTVLQVATDTAPPVAVPNIATIANNKQVNPVLIGAGLALAVYAWAKRKKR